MSNLAFRNVDASPLDPVSTWPLEGMQMALERGGLEDWRRMASAIQADPWGPVARRIEEVLTWSRPYGVAVAFERAIALARAGAEAGERIGPIPSRVCLARGHLSLAPIHLHKRQGHPIGGAAAADAPPDGTPRPARLKPLPG